MTSLWRAPTTISANFANQKLVWENSPGIPLTQKKKNFYEFASLFSLYNHLSDASLETNHDKTLNLSRDTLLTTNGFSELYNDTRTEHLTRLQFRGAMDLPATISQNSRINSIFKRWLFWGCAVPLTDILFLDNILLRNPLVTPLPLHNFSAFVSTTSRHSRPRDLRLPSTTTAWFH